MKKLTLSILVAAATMASTVQATTYAVSSDITDAQLFTAALGGYIGGDGAGSNFSGLQVGGTIEISPDAYWFPAFFSAAPFEKCNDEISDCLCDDELTFTQDANNDLTYELNNNGQTFFNVGHQSVIGEDAGEDACFDFDTSG